MSKKIIWNLQVMSEWMNECFMSHTKIHSHSGMNFEAWHIYDVSYYAVYKGKTSDDSIEDKFDADSVSSDN